MKSDRTASTVEEFTKVLRQLESYAGRDPGSGGAIPSLAIHAGESASLLHDAFRTLTEENVALREEGAWVRLKLGLDEDASKGELQGTLHVIESRGHQAMRLRKASVEWQECKRKAGKENAALREERDLAKRHLKGAQAALDEAMEDARANAEERDKFKAELKGELMTDPKTPETARERIARKLKADPTAAKRVIDSIESDDELMGRCASCGDEVLLLDVDGQRGHCGSEDEHGYQVAVHCGPVRFDDGELFDAYRALAEERDALRRPQENPYDCPNCDGLVQEIADRLGCNTDVILSVYNGQNLALQDENFALREELIKTLEELIFETETTRNEQPQITVRVKGFDRLINKWGARLAVLRGGDDV